MTHPAAPTSFETKCDGPLHGLLRWVDRDWLRESMLADIDRRWFA